MGFYSLIFPHTSRHKWEVYRTVGRAFPVPFYIRTCPSLSAIILDGFRYRYNLQICEGQEFPSALETDCRAPWPRCLSLEFRSLSCRDCGFESRRRKYVSCEEYCLLSGRGFFRGLVTRPEESWQVWCVWVWSLSLENEAPAH